LYGAAPQANAEANSRFSYTRRMRSSAFSLR
jgi:hypothetical protein